MERKSNQSNKKKSEKKTSIPIETSEFIEIGNEENQFTTMRPYQIAILELSTKAVKLMWGDMKRLLHNFDFNHFQNISDLTNTGDCLDEQENLDISKFSKYVLPSIQRLVAEAKRQDVTHLYCVATAAYRSAKNIQEILELIKEKADIDVKVIAPTTEAQLSLSAFLWSSAVTIAEFHKDIIMMDQGGGSVQICWFERDIDLIYTLNTNHDFSLGTTMLKKLLWEEFPGDSNLKDAIYDIENYVRREMGKYFKKIAVAMGNTPKSCFAMGAAMTRATGKASNRKQHLTKMNQSKLEEVVRSAEQAILENHQTIDDLKKDMGFRQKNNDLEHCVVMRLGIPMYLQMMESWNVPEIVVSGTALRYGLYWQKLQFMKRHTD